MDANYIRSLIFLVAGLLMLFFPKKVWRFQVFVLEKLHIKHNLKSDDKYYLYAGIIFIIIAVILFLVALIW